MALAVAAMLAPALPAAQHSPMVNMATMYSKKDMVWMASVHFVAERHGLQPIQVGTYAMAPFKGEAERVALRAAQDHINAAHYLRVVPVHLDGRVQGVRTD